LRWITRMLLRSLRDSACLRHAEQSNEGRRERGEGEERERARACVSRASAGVSEMHTPGDCCFLARALALAFFSAIIRCSLSGSVHIAFSEQQKHNEQQQR
jgi:hypothetical protein